MILHIDLQSQNFCWGDTPWPPQKRLWCLNPDTYSAWLASVPTVPVWGKDHWTADLPPRRKRHTEYGIWQWRRTVVKTAKQRTLVSCEFLWMRRSCDYT